MNIPRIKGLHHSAICLKQVKESFFLTQIKYIYMQKLYFPYIKYISKNNLQISH